MPQNKSVRTSSTRAAAPRAAAPKSAQKSPKHRGWKPETDAAPASKRRWTDDDRAARSYSPSRAVPTGTARRGNSANRDGSTRFAADGRPNWEPRGKDPRPARGDRAGRDERFSRDGRAGRDERPARDERAPRRFDRDERAPRRFDRDERAPRRDRDDRAPRRDAASGSGRFDRDERAPRRFDRDERPARDDRAPRRFDRDDRAPRAFDRDDRTPRREDERAPRRFDRDERPTRDDRAPRRDAANGARRFDRDDRAPRGFDRDDRAPRRFDRDDRAPRGFDRDERAPRRDSSYYPEKSAQPIVDDVVLERLEASAVEATDVEGVTFADLGLGGNIVRTLAELGADAPFPIQAATIPAVLSGKDVLGRGRTGSGKTIAFGAPLVERLMENGMGRKRQMGRSPRAIILAPTRELALQIDRTVQPIARSVGVFTTQVYGGVPYQRQLGALERGVDIVIGTPGRIEDLVNRGALDLSEVMVTVLDEADHMCDLGFLEPVQRIIRETAPDGQKLLFSATLDSGVATLVDEFLVEPEVYEVAGEDQASSTIDHRVLLIEQRDKRELVRELAGGDGKTLVFTRTRAFAEELSEYLEDAGIGAVSLHGDLNQSRRTRNLERLTSGRVNVLVATDVAARGIHVDDISLVIQADAPDEYKTYLHRAGRTGRAGKAGTVVTLVPKNRRRKLDDLLGRAEIEARFDQVAPGDDLVTQLAAL
ncbi:DEAD/DEAH box helicase [Galbitalea sp. SE-J8]|uniref:DEAD/DEAH box helicase n=1 Tax=Galbitalea sp. SE-J8 TaxID=3054952 RepID=UPI00259CB1F7|nr:DEAD/DEAH box helicase [Galbitalea sp. SE-J8]MDM4762200.1 DEAD/DEAH box helicase [Galbitalea sp. SE-J8]